MTQRTSGKTGQRGNVASLNRLRINRKRERRVLWHGTRVIPSFMSCHASRSGAAMLTTHQFSWGSPKFLDRVEENVEAPQVILWGSFRLPAKITAEFQRNLRTNILNVVRLCTVVLNAAAPKATVTLFRRVEFNTSI